MESNPSSDVQPGPKAFTIWRYGVGSALPDRTFRIEVDGKDVTGAVPVPHTGEWDRYETVRVSGVELIAGRQTLRVVMNDLDYMDINWISIVPHAQ